MTSIVNPADGVPERFLPAPTQYRRLGADATYNSSGSFSLHKQIAPLLDGVERVRVLRDPGTGEIFLKPDLTGGVKVNRGGSHLRVSAFGLRDSITKNTLYRASAQYGGVLLTPVDGAE